MDNRADSLRLVDICVFWKARNIAHQASLSEKILLKKILADTIAHKY
jgi:hypothetical protein